jgi:hypothetical protein
VKTAWRWSLCLLFGLIALVVIYRRQQATPAMSHAKAASGAATPAVVEPASPPRSPTAAAPSDPTSLKKQDYRAWRDHPFSLSDPLTLELIRAALGIDVERRHWALDILAYAALPAEVVEYLIGMFGSSDRDRKLTILTALTGSRHSRIDELLHGELRKDSDPLILAAAAKDFMRRAQILLADLKSGVAGGTPAGKFPGPLVEDMTWAMRNLVLDERTTAEIFKYAYECREYLPDLRRALLEVSESDTSQVRRSLAIKFLPLESPNELSRVVSALTDPSAEVRAAGAWRILGDYEIHQDFSALWRALHLPEEDASPQVRSLVLPSVVQALSKMSSNLTPSSPSFSQVISAWNSVYGYMSRIVEAKGTGFGEIERFRSGMRDFAARNKVLREALSGVMRFRDDE